MSKEFHKSRSGSAACFRKMRGPKKHRRCVVGSTLLLYICIHIYIHIYIYMYIYIDIYVYVGRLASSANAWSVPNLELRGRPVASEARSTSQRRNVATSQRRNVAHSPYGCPGSERGDLRVLHWLLSTAGMARAIHAPRPGYCGASRNTATAPMPWPPHPTIPECGAGAARLARGCQAAPSFKSTGIPEIA